MSGQANPKQLARTLVRERLQQTSESDRRAWSAAICKRLIEWPVTRDAATPMVYLPTPDEAGVDCYTQWRLKQGLAVCGPRVDWVSLAMTPTAITGLETGIEVRRHGIREPSEANGALDASEIDVVLTPGVVFDERGQRVGRGAGCYDRFFARNDLMKRVLAIGVCFELQLVEEAPVDDHDRRLDAIVTERRIIEPMKR